MKYLKPALMIFLVFSVLLGGVYPAFVTVISQLVFYDKATGDLSLIGQNFTAPKYFWGRLSATSDHPYNAAASGASNYSFSNENLTKAAKERIDVLKKDAPAEQAVPVELITASGSGLDPHISLGAAFYQVPRVAKARSMKEADVLKIVGQNTQQRFMLMFGEPRVNVLKLNVALDEESSKSKQELPRRLP